MTYYRKYRPQTIEELDNEEIRKRLTAVLSSKSLPHAFLFTGPRGTGKTSAARIIAKAINCEKVLSSKSKVQSKLTEPCNKCDICKAITTGTSLDILEIDAASNRGIDEIRDLREKIKLSPSVCRYKVYIIDEVHMLTTEAFNALLKTLEEPPEHAVFILCTTEPRKLPETIISRCLRFSFKRATIAELERSITRVVDGEKLRIDKEAAREIAKGSDGSFREAAKILEQLSFESQKISLENVKEFLGKIKINRADEFLKFLAGKDTKEAILWINSALQSGADLKILTTDLLEILRNYLIKKTAGIENEEVEYGKPYEKLTLLDIKRLIEIFSQAYFELKSAVIPQLPLELGVVEWSGVEPAFIPPRRDFGEAKPASVPHQTARDYGEAKQEKKEEKVILNKSESQRIAALPQRGFTPEARKPDEKKLLKLNKKTVVNFDQVVSLWPQILEAIKPLNHSVHAVLRGARPLAIEENVLIIEAFYKFHKERLEEPKVNALLTMVISDKLGCQLGVKCVLGEGRPKPTAKPVASSQEKNDNKDDLVKAVEEIFK